MTNASAKSGIDLSKSGDDWRDELEALLTAQLIEQRAGAGRVAATLEQLARWTGATTGR